MKDSPYGQGGVLKAALFVGAQCSPIENLDVVALPHYAKFLRKEAA